MKQYYKFTLAAMLLSGVSAFAGAPAAPYDNSRIDARLNVAVKEDTKVVHFVRDNADPNVVTKAYEIKHTDPYELRSYIRAIVQTKKVSDNNTNVEAVKYSDGTSHFSRHYHDCHELFYVTGGKASITVNAKTYSVRSGMLVIISRYEKHSAKVALSLFHTLAGGIHHGNCGTVHNTLRADVHIGTGGHLSIL